jgi:hypothetical protein
MKITDPRFKYTPAVHTDIASTLRKHGFRPTTDAERKARQAKLYNTPESATVTPIAAKRRKAR